jgi:hypothetical protein
VTKDLRKIQVVIDALVDSAGLSDAERKRVTALANGLRGVRGYDLGELRIAAGMGLE